MQAKRLCSWNAAVGTVRYPLVRISRIGLCMWLSLFLGGLFLRQATKLLIHVRWYVQFLECIPFWEMFVRKTSWMISIGFHQTLGPWPYQFPFCELSFFLCWKVCLFLTILRMCFLSPFVHLSSRYRYLPWSGSWWSTPPLIAAQR